jgi:hypothetical protein
MTLIIGCITSEFAILAGDTQLTVGDLQRGTDLKREVEIKVNKYSHRFMMGILGKWSWFYAPQDGVATYINDFDLLRERLQNNEDEVGYLNKFLPNRQNIDATAIFINSNGDDFTMDSVSNQADRDLSRISIGSKDLMFNEPFYNYRKKMIEEKLLEFSDSCNLDNSLGDVLFLINNTILDVIAKGKTVDLVQDNGVQFFGAVNTVGGYVTIQIMTRDNHYFNCLYRSYNYDYNTLLDKTTYAFSSFINSHPKIRYLDNLVMLIKANMAETNDPFVREELFKCIEKQLKFLSESGIVKNYMLNEFIDCVNEKYNLDLDTIKIEREKEEELLSLELIFGGEEKNIDLDYIKRFI